MQSIEGAEIILSAGAIRSPEILMRSGIGPADELRRLGIEVRADLPAVGKNLCNHPILFIGVHLKEGRRQQPALRPHPVACLRYSSGMDAGSTSDLYINAYSKTSWSKLGEQIGNVNVALLKPKSRGQVTLRSADPKAEPCIEFCFLDDPDDRDRLMQGFTRCAAFTASAHVQNIANLVFPVRYSDRLRLLQQRNRTNAFKSSAIAWALDRIPWLRSLVFSGLTGERIDLQELVQIPGALAEHVRRNVGGTFHLSGTCRMGHVSSSQSVVDAEARVLGFERLSVIDASIMPSIPRGNTFLPTAMLAEKLSAAILHRQGSLTS
jgi:5-(hydroxymethyl)furfural/furfural oxidase